MVSGAQSFFGGVIFGGFLVLGLVCLGARVASLGCQWWGCIFFAVWGVVGCVFAGGGIVRVGGVFDNTVVGWFLRGVVTPHPRVARMVFSVVP